MNIIEFEQGSLLGEFKELNEYRIGRHSQRFMVTAYTDCEDEYFDIKFEAEALILDQSELENLEIDVLAVNGSFIIPADVRKEIEYKLVELFKY